MRGPAIMELHRKSGFTLIEMSVSLGVFVVIATSMLSLAAQTTTFLGGVDADQQVQTAVNLSFQRLSEVLRKSGWVTQGGATYPRLVGAGHELEFRFLAPTKDGGYPIDAATGELEWDARVFSVRRTTDGTLAIYHNVARVLLLGRHIEAVDFYTYLQDSSLARNEIRIVIFARRDDPQGKPVSCTRSESIFMRN